MMADDALCKWITIPFTFPSSGYVIICLVDRVNILTYHPLFLFRNWDYAPVSHLSATERDSSPIDLTSVATEGE